MANRPILKINSLPSELNCDINTQSVLTDLGKPTKRGIKKCFNCGTYNGTRGLICKNKKCNTPFRGINSECDSSIDAIRLITGNTRRVYSVFVKEKGPHHRGFVQLPFTEGEEASNRKVALCFVDSCQRLFDNSILKCHEKKHNNDYLHDSFCTHIESAFKSVHVAKTYDTDKNILNKLDFSEEIKLKLVKLADETVGTVVQQVSKSVMAVKCHVTSKYPLGYLHLTFINCKKKDTFDKYYCNCNQFKDHICSRNADPKCIHYYACIWAFANCPSLPKEFIPIVASEVPYPFGEINLTPSLLNDSNKKKQKLVENKTNVVEGPPPNNECFNIENNVSNNNCTYLDNDPGDSFFNLEEYQMQNDYESAAKRQKIDENIHELVEEIPSVNFVEWLSSVTERINMSLSSHNIDKTIEHLEFQIPETFFDSLKNRINLGSEISRQYFLSNIAITETNQVQHLYNIFSAHHLKEIFDTPQVSLCLVKTVVLNKNSIVMYLQVDRQQKVNNSNIFSIEWSPNVLPTSKFGILTLKFKIGKFN